MSTLENDRIQEALFEDFVELYENSESFQDLVRFLWTWEESWTQKEYGREDEEALGRIFNELWDYDCEALFNNKREAVKSYIKNQVGKRF